MRSIVLSNRILRAFRRTKFRPRALRFLDRPGGAYLEVIALGIGLRASRTWGILEGDGREYKRQDSLVRLGLVMVIHTRHGRFYRITRLGRAVVAALDAVGVSRDGAR